ncbi:MAG: hypothetical protein QOJ45_914 [Verrucomicrobiota bacterium]|jgi:hypothetical protein
MSQSVTVDSDVEIPQENDADLVSVRLVQDGAVHIAYGIALLIDDKPVDPPVASWPHSKPGEVYFVATGLALRGLKMDCYGRVYLAGDDTTKLHCDFLVDDTVVATSATAEIKLSSSSSSREFHIRSHFV